MLLNTFMPQLRTRFPGDFVLVVTPVRTNIFRGSGKPTGMCSPALGGDLSEQKPAEEPQSSAI